MRKKSDQLEFNVANRIVKLREAAGLSTNKLSTITGISQSNLRTIELGQTSPTVETLYLICFGLGVSLNEFFSDDTLNSFCDNPLYKAITGLTTEQQYKLLEFIESIK